MQTFDLAEELKARQGWSRGWFADGLRSAGDAADALMRGEGVPVLAECEGALGTLRGLQTRMGNLIYDLNTSRRTATVALARLVAGVAVIEVWHLHPENVAAYNAEPPASVLMRHEARFGAGA